MSDKPLSLEERAMAERAAWGVRGGQPATTAYVVMGNDFPSAVFSTEAAAEAYVSEKREEEKRRKAQHMTPEIYWRIYPFLVDAVGE